MEQFFTVSQLNYGVFNRWIDNHQRVKGRQGLVGILVGTSPHFDEFKVKDIGTSVTWYESAIKPINK